jgi:hypothetical protein
MKFGYIVPLHPTERPQPPAPLPVVDPAQERAELHAQIADGIATARALSTEILAMAERYKGEAFRGLDHIARMTPLVIGPAVEHIEHGTDIRYLRRDVITLAEHVGKLEANLATYRARGGVVEATKAAEAARLAAFAADLLATVPASFERHATAARKAADNAAADYAATVAAVERHVQQSPSDKAKMPEWSTELARLRSEAEAFKLRAERLEAVAQERAQEHHAAIAEVWERAEVKALAEVEAAEQRGRDALAAAEAAIVTAQQALEQVQAEVAAQQQTTGETLFLVRRARLSHAEQRAA